MARMPATALAAQPGDRSPERAASPPDTAQVFLRQAPPITDPPADDHAGSGVTPMEEAQAALRRGDSAAAVRALEGRTRSPRELGLLIEVYRSMANTRAACRNMDLFTRRYGSTPQATSYRQMSARSCNGGSIALGPGQLVVEPAPSAPADPGATPMEEAQAAMHRGDTNGVVRALEGRTRSPRELGLLIEAYRNVGNTRAACRNMDLFIRRYSTVPQANTYRQLFARTCNQ
jgi:hypothetical protein